MLILMVTYVYDINMDTLKVKFVTFEVKNRVTATHFVTATEDPRTYGK